MANEAYNSGINLESLMVPVKAATIYTAQETSLFLGGNIIPMVNVPAGSASAQVPFLGTVTADKISTEATPGADLEAEAIADTTVTIPVSLYAVRTVLRDLGGIDPQEIGRTLGNAVAAKFDADVVAQLTSASITQDVDIGTSDVTVANVYDAVAAIRGAGDMTQLFAVCSTDVAAELMKNVASTGFAGGDYQTEALRNGFVTRIAGVNVFQSAHMTANQMTVFGQDAFRIAMQKNIDLEVSRRAAAVGNDVVASIHAGVGLVDASRASRIYDAA